MCSNGICQCSKQYSGNVCQFKEEKEEEPVLELQEDQTNLYIFYGVLVLLILVILGVALYLQRGLNESQPQRFTG